jgi:CDP-glucose 4,6-dehydratase
MEQYASVEDLGMKEFFSGKRVFITGNTGFKGSWLSQILLCFGATVRGYALPPPTNPSLFDLLNLKDEFETEFADIRAYESLCKSMNDFKPDVVLHLAAQPIVIESYNNPVTTYETNVIGTVNLLDAARKCASVSSIINVTTDKVYQNNEWCYGYRETDYLDGYDPYSNSKSCSELVTSAFRRCFFAKSEISVSAVRAGNVIGGGDFSNFRIVPDCYRAVSNAEPLLIRNPNSVRPYQHVLEPLFGYLRVAEQQCLSPSVQGVYNIGPETDDSVSTKRLARLYNKYQPKLQYEIIPYKGPHEANFLRLDISKIREAFNIRPIYNIETAMKNAVTVYDVISENGDIRSAIIKQVDSYAKEFERRIRL